MKKEKGILVVEDELLVALLYDQYLSKRGFEIIGPYTTGKEVIASLNNIDFGAVLLDIQLDDNITGIEVAEKIREKTLAPIIFTTGNDSKKTAEQSSHIANTFVLPKPIDFEELLEIINN